MLECLVADSLALNDFKKRSFLVSVSGGSDSVALLFVLHNLRKKYPLRLRIFHMNFQLRGKDSLADEIFVRRLSKELKIPISVRRVKKTKTVGGVQEWAREQRLKQMKRFSSEYEVLEAHHLDDQVETFFLRLMRGAGIGGLDCIRESSCREGRQVWRPLLKISKKEIRHYLSVNKIKFREDHSNQTTKYDRNWLRLKVLPLFFRKEPQLRIKIAELLEEVQDLNRERASIFEKQKSVVLINDVEWNWAPFLQMSDSERKNFVRRICMDQWKISLTRRQILEFSRYLSASKSFSLNLPKGLVARGLAPSRKYSAGLLKVDLKRKKTA